MELSATMYIQTIYTDLTDTTMLAGKKEKDQVRQAL